MAGSGTTALTVRIGPLHLANPVIVASGVCGFGERDTAALNQAGAIVCKTVTRYPRPGNPVPRAADAPSGMINSIGLENPGVEHLAEKLPKLRSLHCRVIGSFLGEDAGDFRYLLERMESYGVFHAYEVNLSCPNVTKGAWFYDRARLSRLLRELRAGTRRALIAKLSPEKDPVGTAALARDAGFDAVTLINTYTAVAVDPWTRRYRIGNIVGGLSGPCIKPLALRWVREVALGGDIPVIGCGGIVSADDAVEFMLVGAVAVQVGCGWFRDPSLPGAIVRGLRTYLRRERLTLGRLRGFLLR
jgi:dihydroorotate dehydrogenase (NAD+) catalytic subunit